MGLPVLPVYVRPDDLARVIDAKRLSVIPDGQRVAEVGEAAAAEEKTAEDSAPTTAICIEKPNDLARAVDAGCLGEAGQGMIERREDIHWHVVTRPCDRRHSLSEAAAPG